jgi:hypothetical protein
LGFGNVIGTDIDHKRCSNAKMMFLGQVFETWFKIVWIVQFFLKLAVTF